MRQLVCLRRTRPSPLTPRPHQVEVVHFVRNVAVAMLGKWIEDGRDHVADWFAVVSAVEGFPIC